MNLYFQKKAGFTLVEMLIGMAVLSLIMVMVFTLTGMTGTAVRRSSAQVEAFKAARKAFDALSLNLAQATLNTYYDYYDANRSPRTPSNSATFVPARYGRQSDLHFVSGSSLVPSAWDCISHSVFFQSSLGYATQADLTGLEHTLNNCGYFVAYGEDITPLPAAAGISLQNTKRFRLYQFIQPTEKLMNYASGASPLDWFRNPLLNAAGKNMAQRNGVHVLADNILALILRPRVSQEQDAVRDSLSGDYQYDSHVAWTGGNQPAQMHQLPPLVDVAVLALDEASSKQRLTGAESSSEAVAVLGVEFEKLFRKSAELDADLQLLQEQLAARHVVFRLLRTTVQIRGSNWTRL